MTPNAVASTPLPIATNRDHRAGLPPAIGLRSPHYYRKHATGLFYGVQTFVQLLKLQNGTLWLPEGEIEDWPDLELRIIYWDDAHHLEHLDVLKAALRQASFYKINGFAIKLEGHFQYQHAPADCRAVCADSGRVTGVDRLRIEVSRRIDSVSRRTGARRFYSEASRVCNACANTRTTITSSARRIRRRMSCCEGMFEDLLAANKGGKYFVLSTDEPYYVGLAKNEQCQEAERADSWAVSVSCWPSL